MKRLVSLITAAALIISAAAVPAEVKADVQTGYRAGVQCQIFGPQTSKERVMTLRRGETLKTWAFPFTDTKKLYEDPSDPNDEEEGEIRYFTLEGAKGTVRVSSDADWLTAKIKSGRVYVTVKGKNTGTASLAGTVKISDKKGTFAKVNVVRGGLTRFTGIRQKKKHIELTLRYAKAAEKEGFITAVTFNKKGKAVKEEYITNEKRLEGKTVYLDTITTLRAGYTYAYVIGYIAPAVSFGYGTCAAAVKIAKTSGSAKGKVKVITNSQKGYDTDWLWEILH